MKKKILISLCLLLFVNVLPYVCRLYRGLTWAGQYLPKREHLVGGLLFLHAFASVPAFLMILAVLLGKPGRWALVASLVAATAGLVYWHHDFDLASDAQAGIALIVIPLWVAVVLETPAFLVGLIAQRLFRRASGPPPLPCRLQAQGRASGSAP